MSDRAVAVLTLDDGRKVRVLLTGSADDAPEVLDADGLPAPTIVMDVAEVGMAAMSPEDIRPAVGPAAGGVDLGQALAGRRAGGNSRGGRPAATRRLSSTLRPAAGRAPNPRMKI